MKVFIIEDDLSTAIGYEVILKQCGIKDIAVLNSIDAAKEKISEKRPDIVILDLYLKNELSLGLVPELKKLRSDIILVTAYPKNEFIEKAVDFDVVTFLPKPVNPHTLRFQIQSITQKRVNSSNESFCYIKTKNNFIRIPYSSILFLETEGNYTSIFTSTGKYILKRSLKNVSSELPSSIFTRVHRNFVVNHNHVKQLDLKNNQLEMINHTIIQIGGKYRNDIKKVIASKFIIL